MAVSSLARADGRDRTTRRRHFVSGRVFTHKTGRKPGRRAALRAALP